MALNPGPPGGVSQPVLLTLLGLVLAQVPGIADLHIAPQLTLLVVLPPLLFAATQRTTVREFKDNARPVLLAVGLTTAKAAVVPHATGMAWAPAWVLRAIISPPDPEAATTVSRGLRCPTG